ncbi:uncharacterized protein LY79DRAFT_286035 [Colletotrichum navitas]|uniref:Uncharacterized protein n=1 Tax=Colletotrichum navitas TaxID=681940 RepID=A0AAD8Q942_9PEZI|nr:uncharacterized protein LY79DRAFT_286035 [Colletotrichum navitas]KAK1598321.1 hypothetical protein LY79DRAFT_286035 [Colletotrichum navitas]
MSQVSAARRTASSKPPPPTSRHPDPARGQKEKEKKINNVGYKQYMPPNLRQHLHIAPPKYTETRTPRRAHLIGRTPAPGIRARTSGSRPGLPNAWLVTVRMRQSLMQRLLVVAWVDIVDGEGNKRRASSHLERDSDRNPGSYGRRESRMGPPPST